MELFVALRNCDVQSDELDRVDEVRNRRGFLSRLPAGISGDRCACVVEPRETFVTVAHGHSVRSAKQFGGRRVDAGGLVQRGSGVQGEIFCCLLGTLTRLHRPMRTTFPLCRRSMLAMPIFKQDETGAIRGSLVS